MIEGDESEEIEDHFLTIVRGEGLTQRVFLKDRRRRNAAHLAGLLGRYCADASHTPTDTGTAFEWLAASAKSSLVVGTPLGAKVLRRLERNSYPAAQFATDAMLLCRNVSQPI
ncbi:hypothetical protein [Bradyrhizobium sp. 21]|uniref:hypothetical protein n=1 Tax=Bradyrhizobium sp. 21 TaxID=2782666 RepID=UPI001FF9DBB4|nr:hypothetical protein [Bradyrhizobium sp. 21]MCK1384091.1 hypothetical protein [Bradyrhizobium sp. 21]